MTYPYSNNYPNQVPFYQGNGSTAMRPAPGGLDWMWHNTVTSTPSPQPNNTYGWAKGLDGANAYPVAPGVSIPIFDVDEPVLYYKQSDALGRPLPLRVFDLVERTEQPQQASQEAVDYDKIRQIVSEEVNTRLNRNNKPRVKKEGESNG